MNVQIRLGILMALLALAACGQTTPAKNGETKELPIPPEYQDKVQEEFVLGGLLKTYDDVAWLGSDATEAAGYTPQQTTNSGYVVEPIGDDLNGLYQFMFITESAGKLNVAAIAQVDHSIGDMGKVTGVRKMGVPTEPSYNDAQMYRALQAAGNAPGLQLCHTRYNHIVLPYSNGSKVEYRVYFLVSSNQENEIPIAGHVLVRIAEDASTVLEVKPLSKSCSVMQQDPAHKAVAISGSNLALDYPSAAQVFTMYRYRLPVYVMTRNMLLWAIDSRGIRLLGDRSKEQDKN